MLSFVSLSLWNQQFYGLWLRKHKEQHQPGGILFEQVYLTVLESSKEKNKWPLNSLFL